MLLFPQLIMDEDKTKTEVQSKPTTIYKIQIGSKIKVE